MRQALPSWGSYATGNFGCRNFLGLHPLAQCLMLPGPIFDKRLDHLILPCDVTSCCPTQPVCSLACLILAFGLSGTRALRYRPRCYCCFAQLRDAPVQKSSFASVLFVQAVPPNLGRRNNRELEKSGKYVGYWPHCSC